MASAPSECAVTPRRWILRAASLQEIAEPKRRVAPGLQGFPAGPRRGADAAHAIVQSRSEAEHGSRTGTRSRANVRSRAVRWEGLCEAVSRATLLRSSLKSWTSACSISRQRQKDALYRTVTRERATGVEPATSSLGSWHSTTELRPQEFTESYPRPSGLARRSTSFDARRRRK